LNETEGLFQLILSEVNEFIKDDEKGDFFRDEAALYRNAVAAQIATVL